MKKPKNTLLTLIAGVVGVILFRWIPESGRDFLVYGFLLALLIALGILLYKRTDSEDGKTRL